MVFSFALFMSERGYNVLWGQMVTRGLFLTDVLNVAIIADIAIARIQRRLECINCINYCYVGAELQHKSYRNSISPYLAKQMFVLGNWRTMQANHSGLGPEPSVFSMGEVLPTVAGVIHDVPLKSIKDLCRTPRARSKKTVLWGPMKQTAACRGPGKSIQTRYTPVDLVANLVVPPFRFQRMQ